MRLYDRKEQWPNGCACVLAIHNARRERDAVRCSGGQRVVVRMVLEAGGNSGEECRQSTHELREM